jgi:Ca2+-binding EF-hand superfamily protein
MTSINSSTQSAYLANIQKQAFNRIDANGDGKVTKDEFVKGRPDDVSASKAGNLFDKLDKNKTGSLSESDLSAAAPPTNGGLDPSLIAALLQGQDQNTTNTTPDTSSGDDHFADFFKSTDTDKNGKVSKEEFVKARPQEVSEKQASDLFDKIDKSASGEVTADQLKTGIQANRPSPPSQTGSSDGSSSSDDPIQALIDALNKTTKETSTKQSTSSTTNSKGTAALEAFLNAVKSYSTTANYTKSSDATALLATA